jgi:hypothetical protein
MRVYNLACGNEHAFEGWFSSGEDFNSQQARGLIQCPICDDARISKRLHAPAVLRRAPAGARQDEAAAESVAEQAHTELKALIDNPNVSAEAKIVAVKVALSKYIRANTQDVGLRFADEARAMHYNEKPHRSIRGQADGETIRELLDEGIEVMPVPFLRETPDLH